MPRWIHILQWVIAAVRIPVQRLRVAGAGHNTVRLDEPAQLGVVVAGTVIVQPGVVVEDLAGEAVRDVERLRVVGEPFLAERSVFVMLDKVALQVGLSKNDAAR